MKRPEEDPSSQELPAKRHIISGVDSSKPDVSRISEDRGSPFPWESVSVIVALFNAEAFIEEFLDSVLEQTYEGPLEVVVHDDASTDGSAAVLAVSEPAEIKNAIRCFLCWR